MNFKITGDSVLLVTARNRFVADDLTSTVRICNEILSTHPDDFEALHLLGGVAMRRGNPFKAAEFLRKSIRSRPANASAHLNLARALYQQGKLDDAIQACRKAIKLQNDLVDARRLLEIARNEVACIDQEIKRLEKSEQWPLISFNQNERERNNPEATTLNKAVRLYKHFGYLVLEDLFSTQFINNLYCHFKDGYSQYFRDSAYEDALLVGDKRFMVTVKLEGPFKDPEYYANPFVMPLLTRLLGGEFILFSLGAVISLPGASPQRTHRDHRSLFEEDGIDELLPSFAITLGTPLIEMNDLHGTTRVYGKTHRNSDDLTNKDKNTGINPLLREGSCILFDYRLLHEGTPNKSTNVRPLMYNIYTRPWFRDCQNYSKQPPLAITPDQYSDIPNAYQGLFSWNRKGR